MELRHEGRLRASGVAAVATAVLAVAACASSGTAPTVAGPGGGPPSARTPSQQTSATAPGSPMGGGAAIDGCDRKAVEKPAVLTLACGDGGITLSALVWSGWGGTTATAKGTYSELSCVPSCVAGTEKHYAATVSVTGLTGGVYTTMHIDAPGASNPSVDYSLTPTGPLVRG